jgi:hypothetical protein
MVCTCTQNGRHGYHSPCTLVDPTISGYDRVIDELSGGAAKYNSHWRPCFNPNGFTPTGYM